MDYKSSCCQSAALIPNRSGKQKGQPELWLVRCGKTVSAVLMDVGFLAMIPGRFDRKERSEHREMTVVGCDRFGAFMKGLHEPLEPFDCPLADLSAYDPCH